MKTLFRTLTLVALCALSGPTLAAEAVPINATFGIQWTPIDWTSDPAARQTLSIGAAGLPNGSVISIISEDVLNPGDGINGSITSKSVIIAFSYSDWVYAEYDNIPAIFDPASGTASFFGPMKVVGGEGRFQGATGTLSIRSRIIFPYGVVPPVGTFDIKGVIKTAN
jgi:hypothetical protein